MSKAYLVLEDGRVFEGTGFGAPGEVYGEVVFNTSLTGYQEILTDPSYNGQIVSMTYPEIGNYGVNAADMESRRPFVRGFVVKEYWKTPSNWRSERPLDLFLREYGIVGIEGVDTRALTRHIRTRGALKGVISTTDSDVNSLLGKVNSSRGIVGIDLVTEVSCEEPYGWKEGSTSWSPDETGTAVLPAEFNVVAYDFGMKRNIIKKLVNKG